MPVVRLYPLYGAVRRRIMASRFIRETTVHPGQRQLLVDVSTIVRSDVRTGIQRVVRSLLGQLTANTIPGVKIQPIFASRNHGFCKATFGLDGSVVNTSLGLGQLQPVEVRKGDIFLGLDLAAQTLPLLEGELAAWRREGVSINLLVYDLLPLTNPEWFSPKLGRNFRRWFGLLARQGDRCICISETVAADLARLLAKQGTKRKPVIDVIPLGADIEYSFPSLGFPDSLSQIEDFFLKYRALLTVGTIEPRKGHEPLLDAFDHIWRWDPDSDIALVMVGRAGWKTGQLQERISCHPELGKRLMWIDQASDELLSRLYRNCAGLVSASYQEGFGLPLIEAAVHDAPVLARDIPVFREIGGNKFSYFDSDEPTVFAARIQDWLINAMRPSQAEKDELPRWSDSAAALNACLGLSPSTEQIAS